MQPLGGSGSKCSRVARLAPRGRGRRLDSLWEGPSGPRCATVGRIVRRGASDRLQRECPNLLNQVGQRETIALVLAGGGARGAYEVGALSALAPALAARGETLDIIVGTSIGALNGAFLRGSRGRAPGGGGRRRA